MAKKVVTQKEVVEEKLNLYFKQRDDIEDLIDKYIGLYQKLNGAIEATQDILNNLSEGESKTENP